MNARSICNKTESIIGLYTDLNIDVAIITETWLTAKHTHTINLLSSPPYTFLSFPRDSRAGGIGIMYKSHLTISSTNHILSPNAEFVTFSLHSHNSKSIKWIVVYRPPDSSISSFIDEFIVLIESFSTDNFIILGDFNMMMNKSQIYSTKLFQSTLIRNSLFQHNFSHTYFRKYS